MAIRLPRSRRGFTLIEAIIAVVVMAIAIPPMFWAFRDSNVRRVDPINVSRARWLAEEKLEDILADARSTTRGYTYVIDANYPAEAPVAGFTGFYRSVAITQSGVGLVAGSGTGFKTATVSVVYVDGKGGTRTLSVSTVVGSY
jgi:prepilin-type N-terminal cleavage/methylation domain-containing protein